LTPFAAWTRIARVRGDQGFVVADRDVPETTEAGDTAATRVTIDARAGSERLEQRLIRFSRGRSRERLNRGRHELSYVVSGRATIVVEGVEHGVEAESGVFITGGERYHVDNAGPDDLVVVSVLVPAEHSPNGGRRVVVRYADRPTLPATRDRDFRYLVDVDAGCEDATQFLGTIRPGREGMHSHVYDEVIYVVDGEGGVHFEGWSSPIAAGSCIHLPPYTMHILENSGSTPMRVLGVFHPSGDPASRAREEPTG
jgi:mannose-6-phosphate isomerase-like protein (cupin superfamily)